MKKIYLFFAVLVMPMMLMAQPGRIGQPQMQPQIPIQRQPQMQPQRQPSATMDDQMQKAAQKIVTHLNGTIRIKYILNAVNPGFPGGCIERISMDQINKAHNIFYIR